MQLRRGWFKWAWVCAVVVVGVVSLPMIAGRRRRAPDPPRSTAPPIPATAQAAVGGFAGEVVCGSCHAREAAAWTGSHHQLAMQEANESTVLGNFANTKLKHFAVESTMFRRDGKFMVRTDGADGKLADFEINYTFGVWPLQQYLVRFPGGRYQTLPIAWDARTKEEGGQRWFHIYPNDKMDHTDQLHWAGLYQNWNLQCAACHSTNLKKVMTPRATPTRRHSVK